MKCAMMFPGYGNQFVGMGKELYDESRVIQEHFEEAAHCLNTNFVQICFASSEQELRRTVYAYPALFILGSACYALLQERSIIADVYAGFDIGGYTALHAAGGMSYPDGLYILQKLANFYQECLSHRDMIAFRVTGLDEPTVQDLCQASSTEDNWVAIGAYEDETTFVLVGHQEVAESLREHMHSIRNVKAKVYPMEAGAYAPICDDFMMQYKPYLQKIDYHELSYPVVGVDGTLLHSRDAVRSMLLHQLFQPAYYDHVAQHLQAYDAIIIPMPDKHLTTYLRNQIPDTPIYTVTTMQDLDTLERKIVHREEEE